jgi:hypothetical protein
MAILCNISDRHLYTVSSAYGSSTDPYSITVWINGVWSSGGVLSFVGMYDGGIVTPIPTTGLQIGSRGVGQLTCWTYGGRILVQSAAGTMTPFDNQWVLITYTFDGTTNRVYRNSTLLASDAALPTPGTFTQIYINGFPPTGSTSECSTHQVDSYSYYRRTLSQPEIETIFNAQGARNGILFGQVAKYEFDELSAGSTVSNVSDLTINSTPMLNTGAGSPITYSYANGIANSNLRPVQ